MFHSLWNILCGRWCSLHKRTWESGELLCPACWERHVRKTAKDAANLAIDRATLSELEKAVIVDGVLAAVRKIAKQAETLEEFEIMLEQWTSFKHKS